MQDKRLAIIVDPSLPVGLMANTVGAVAIGLGAAAPFLGDVKLKDLDGHDILTSSDRPVPILQADENAMTNLFSKCLKRADESQVVVFPAFARALHSFEEYRDLFPSKSLKAEKIDGIGLCGEGKWVRSLTGSLKLLR